MERALSLEQDHLVLGRYRPLRPLGSGGSGSVWLARDEHAGLEVALKVVPREGKAGSRAEREVEAATRLRHRRCLRALALHSDADHVYVAYEHIRGRTLREALRGGALDDATAIEAAAQVLEALAHAHAKGVVHRDVKPANVMLEDADEVSVRLLDFGLARVDEAEGLTATGDVPGTLAYIAPERLDGEIASGAADVWAVGVMLWEALAGWHPFAAGSPVETARRIAAGPQPLAGQRPDLPRTLCDAVDRMLALQPRRRPNPKQAALVLRSALEEKARRRRATTSRRTVSERALHAGCAALAVATPTLLLPFFPAGWPFGLAALCALAALRSPIVGLVLALAAPVLPLGNVSLDLALAWLPVAAVWLALFARRPRESLLFLVAIPLGPLGLLPLAAVATIRMRHPLRRAATGAAAVLLAGAVASLRETARPLAGDVGAVLAYLAAHPGLLVESAVVAAGAAAAPYVLRWGLWGIAGWASVFLTAAVLGPVLAGGPSAATLGPTLAVWGAAALLAGSSATTPS